MTKLLLASLRIEYETTSITLDSLCHKHKVKPEQLKGSIEWKKKPGIIEDVEIVEPITIEAEQPTIVKEVEPIEASPIQPTIVTKPKELTTKPEEPTIELTIEDKIKDFKEKAIDAALVFINQDVRFAEIKEFKDMVSIVDSIDSSLKKPSTNNAPTINILVQNLTERYKDDC